MDSPTASWYGAALDGLPRKWIFGKSGRDPLLVPSLALFLGVATLRLAAVFNDFWFDEIWSLHLSRLVASPDEILTKLTHDNNHPLNTFFLWAMGDQRSWEWYRLLSFVTGVASVGVMGIIGRRYGRAESSTALVLGGFSYFLIQYSSEARGYAPAVFFALIGFLLAGETPTGKSMLHCGLFWLTVLLGFLSHSTYIFAYSGFFAWSALRLLKHGNRLRQVAAEMLKLHGIPMAFLAGDLLWLNSLTIGGGPEYAISGVILETIQLTFGLPGNQWLAVFACLAAAALLIWGSCASRREIPDQWIFYLTTILLAPAIVLIAVKPAVLFPRYFLVCIPFFLLLLARWLAWVARRGTPWKVLSASFLVLYCSCNMLLFGDLVRYGRGGYSKAMNSIARQTEGGAITIGSDHDFRNRMIVDFYSRYLPPGKKVVYVPGTGILPESAPEWLIVHRVASDPPSAPSPRLLLSNGSGYVCKEVFPSSTLSGFWWYLYRKVK